ncbi:TPA: hypothetical protein HNO24_26390 [Escherichia coli]|nr:hypothetical protein [Escherichia coli]HAJ7170716.1 hypothetical protein [Escherichia coli]HAJ7200005.1 hypothetical protein [Escherichia coli]
MLFIVDSPLHSIKGNCSSFDAARIGITSQSIDIGTGDIVSQAGDKRRNNAHSPDNLRVVRFYAEYITFQTQPPTYAASAAYVGGNYGYMWHRNKTTEARRKPVLIDRFHLTHLHPAKLYPLSAMTEPMCAVGVVPTRVYPQSERISA